MPDQRDTSSDDARVMRVFHYKQELRRTIRMFGSFAIAFSFISITTGIFTNYGFVLRTSGPAGIWTWPLVTVGQMLVALVFAELSARMPLTGYSYQWVTRLSGPFWGWFTGWLGVWFLIIVVPTVNSGLAPVVARLFDIDPNSYNLDLIVIGAIVLQAVIHIAGVQIANRINATAVFTEVAGMVGLTVIFAVLAIKNRPSLDILLSVGDTGPGDFTSYLPAFIMSSLMGAYTLVGFESAANLSEETVDSSKTVPKAVIYSVLASGTIGTLFLIFTVLAITDLPSVTASEYPLPMIIEASLGPLAASLFFVLVIISIFACGLVIMASGSRLVYAMARDRVFPASGLFSRVSPHTSVPIPAIVLIMIAGALVTIFTDKLTHLVAATAVLPALIYLLTVCSYALRRKDMPTQFGNFTLGKWGGIVSALAIAWLVSIIAILTIPSEFHTPAKVTGGLCVAGVIIYFAFFKGKIASGEAGIHSTRPEDRD